MKSLFHIFPIKSRLFPLNPVYSPALGILFDGFNTLYLTRFFKYYSINNEKDNTAIIIPESKVKVPVDILRKGLAKKDISVYVIIACRFYAALCYAVLKKRAV